MQVAYYELLVFLFWETFGSDWELFCAKSCKVRGNVAASNPIALIEWCRESGGYSIENKTK
jgi:hypothetical protein